MAEQVTSGGWADKLRAMPTGEAEPPREWSWLNYGTASAKAPFDIFSRMTTGGRVGLLSPDERAAVSGVKDMLPKGAANAFDAALEYSAALPPGMLLRGPSAMPVTLDMQVKDARAAAQAARNAEIDRFHMSIGMRPYIEPKPPRLPPSLESDAQIIPRASTPAAAPVPPPPANPRATPSQPPVPQTGQPGSQAAGSPAATAQNAFEPVPGQSQSASVPPPPPGPNFNKALTDLESRLRGEALFTNPLGIPEQSTINILNEVAREYGIPPRMLSGRALTNDLSLRMPPPRRIPEVLPEPPPLNAFEAAGGKAQLRLPLPTTADQKMQFWNDLQAVLNHGGKLSDLDRAALTQSSGLTSGMARNRINRAGATGLDGPALADFIRRGIESGNWKLAAPPIAAGAAGGAEWER